MGFFSKLKKMLQNISPAYTFRLVNVVGRPETKDIKIIYQVSGKSTVIEEKPDQLVNELMSLNGFSKKDSEAIYDVAIAERISPVFKIASIIFDSASVKFEIEDLSTRCTFVMNSEDIVNSPALWRHFSGDDLFKVCFQSIRDSDKKEKLVKAKLNESTYCTIHLIKGAEVDHV